MRIEEFLFCEKERKKGRKKGRKEGVKESINGRKIRR